MAKPIRYLYFRIYSWNRQRYGDSDIPQHDALLGTSFLMLLNLLSVPIALDQRGVTAVAPGTFRYLVIILMLFTFGLNAVPRRAGCT